MTYERAISYHIEKRKANERDADDCDEGGIGRAIISWRLGEPDCAIRGGRGTPLGEETWPYTRLPKSPAGGRAVQKKKLSNLVGVVMQKKKKTPKNAEKAKCY